MKKAAFLILALPLLLSFWGLQPAGAADGVRSSLVLKFPETRPYGDMQGKLLRVKSGLPSTMPARFTGRSVEVSPGFVSPGSQIAAFSGPRLAGAGFPGGSGTPFRADCPREQEISLAYFPGERFRVVKISCGDSHALALLSDGRLLSWGKNDCGQLGDGTTQNRSVPGYVLAGAGPSDDQGRLVGVVDVSAGGSHNLAFLSDGRVLSWGRNDYGRYERQGVLGDGTTENRYLPVFVRAGAAPGDNQGNLAGVAAVSARGPVSAALLSDGTVLTWGADDYAQLGDGDNVLGNCRLVPGYVVGFDGSGRLSGVVSVSAGGNRCHALLSDGRVAAWGFNKSGDLAIGSRAVWYVSTPALVISGEAGGPDGRLGDSSSGRIRQVTAASFLGFAVRSDSRAFAWGGHAHESVLGTNASYLAYALDEPTRIYLNEHSAPGISHISVTGHHALAIRPDGAVLSWGYNDYGATGLGLTSDNVRVPMSVLGEGGSGNLTGAVSVAAGCEFSLALLSDGRLLSWGRNDCGQLGDGTNADRAYPGQVLLP